MSGPERLLARLQAQREAEEAQLALIQWQGFCMSWITIAVALNHDNAETMLGIVIALCIRVSMLELMVARMRD